MNDIYLIRHGMTYFSKTFGELIKEKDRQKVYELLEDEKVIDVQLMEVQQQLEQTCQHLKEFEFSHVFISPMTRT